MKTLMICVAAGAACLASSATAHDTITPHDSRGDCEQAMAEINNVDREFLFQNYPQFFSSRGEVMKHLNEDFKCEIDENDGQWYIVDHRFD